jgi:hypothetical protein
MEIMALNRFGGVEKNSPVGSTGSPAELLLYLFQPIDAVATECGQQAADGFRIV